MDIYIKPTIKTSISGRTEILTKDVCEVVAPESVAEKIKNLRLTEIKTTEKKKNYLISCTDIIKTITAAYPEACVSNVGETDTVVQYAAVKKKDNPFLAWTKVLFVVLVLLTGSATAIMSFHTDAQIPKVFENYHKIFYGKENKKPLILDVPYSIGLAAGILVFFNHALGKKMTDDPTPIEVEMSQYEKEVDETLLDILNDERNGNDRP